MTPKNRYRALCKSELSIPIFSRDWWLDATAGDEYWDVSIVEKDGQILAALPFMIKERRFRQTILTQPLLTQTLGPWLRSGNAKYTKRLAQQKDWMLALIDQLPPHAHYAQNWHHEQTNWLPFYWRGFKQTTRYTYRLIELSDREALWRQFASNIRSDIRKAENRFELSVKDFLSVDEFLDLTTQTFNRQGMNLRYSREYVQTLDTACATHGARKIFVAEDTEGRKHAGVYMIWDENSAYYLMGGGNPALRNSGATSLCMWEAIRFASTVTKSFDFEGSMIEPVERFFRGFGAIQTPYFAVSRTPSPFIRALIAAKAMLRN